MSDPQEEFAHELTAFRPRGELQLAENLLFDISRRTGTDPALRLRLQSNDRVALVQMGLPVAVAARVVVHVEGPDDCHLVLPANPRADGASEGVASVLERARLSEDFCRRLLSDPRAAIQEELKLVLPPQLAVQVHQNSVLELHLVVCGSADALSDAELDRVAGGQGGGVHADGAPDLRDWRKRLHKDLDPDATGQQ
jgi:hypothetical protein